MEKGKQSWSNSHLSEAGRPGSSPRMVKGSSTLRIPNRTPTPTMFADITKTVVLNQSSEVEFHPLSDTFISDGLRSFSNHLHYVFQIIYNILHVAGGVRAFTDALGASSNQALYTAYLASQQKQRGPLAAQAPNPVFQTPCPCLGLLGSQATSPDPAAAAFLNLKVPLCTRDVIHARACVLEMRNGCTRSVTSAPFFFFPSCSGQGVGLRKGVDTECLHSVGVQESERRAGPEHERRRIITFRRKGYRESDDSDREQIGLTEIRCDLGRQGFYSSETDYQRFVPSIL